MKSASDVLKLVKDKDVKFVDFRFTDTKGKMQHVTAHASTVGEDTFQEGYAFDGSSIAGWKGIESSDMLLMPDADVGPPRSVLRPVDRRPLLRRPGADHRPVLRARPARHRQEGRGLHEVDGHRRHDLFRPGSRVLHLRRRELLRRHVQHRFQGRLHRAADEHGHRLRDGQPRPPPAHQGRLLPGSADRQLPGHPLRDDLGDDRDGRRRRKAPPRGGRRSARARRQVRPDDQHGRPSADL